MSHPTPRYHASLRVPAAVMVIIPRQAQAMVVLLLVAVSLSLFLFVPHTLADEQTLDAPGSIAGMVKTGSGETQAGIKVTLYQRDSYYYDSWRDLRTITTQADGKYRFTLLSAGTYRIGANDPMLVYAPVYYPAAPTISNATNISITGNQLEGTDLTLQPAGRITGIVSLTGGLTMTYGSVALYQEGEYNGNRAWQPVQQVYLPLNSGVYTFTGLGVLPYRICATVGSVTLSVAECYDNVYDVNAATSIIATAGATIRNVNLVLGDGANFAQISGQVTSLTNQPLTNIDVYAILVSPEAEVMIPVPPRFPIAYATHTDSTGNYHFPTVIEGRYWLYFTDVTGQYAVKYHNDTLLTEAATVIEVAPKEVISNVNVQLGPGSHLRGLLTILGQPVPNALVTIQMRTASAWRSVAGATFDANTGHYDSGGLPPGDYRVIAFTMIGDSYTFHSYTGYFGGSTLDTAAEITLGVGITKTADITLSGGPRFEGSVAGRITANGVPLAGAKVSLYRGGFSCCSSLLEQPSIYLFTDAEGRYRVNGLDGSVYTIGASDPAGLYATTYYANHAVPDWADILTPDDYYSPMDININLPVAGAISGRVTTSTDKAVADLLVSIYANPMVAPGYNLRRLVSNNTRTDADGRYLVKGLHAGDYYVCFGQAPGSADECYGRPDLGDSQVSGLLVNVVAGETHSNIDLLWGPI